MKTSEKVAFIKGLMEGLALDPTKPETKILSQMADVLEELAASNNALIEENIKLKDYIEQMRENVARHLNIDIDCVNVKATTTEKLGFEGEGLGISTHAVACIEKA